MRYRLKNGNHIETATTFEEACNMGRMILAMAQQILSLSALLRSAYLFLTYEQERHITMHDLLVDGGATFDA